MKITVPLIITALLPVAVSVLLHLIFKHAEIKSMSERTRQIIIGVIFGIVAICGTEFGNAYSELNNPFDQKERFLAQMAARNRGDDEANEIDYTFLDALDYGMPPAGGIGMGIDRLCMLMAEEDTIREVLLFPTMKDEK